jgi:hypothetical protein
MRQGEPTARRRRFDAAVARQSAIISRKLVDWRAKPTIRERQIEMALVERLRDLDDGGGDRQA